MAPIPMLFSDFHRHARFRFSWHICEYRECPSPSPAPTSALSAERGTRELLQATSHATSQGDPVQYCKTILYGVKDKGRTSPTKPGAQYQPQAWGSDERLDQTNKTLYKDACPFGHKMMGKQTDPYCPDSLALPASSAPFTTKGSL